MRAGHSWCFPYWGNPSGAEKRVLSALLVDLNFFSREKRATFCQDARSRAVAAVASSVTSNGTNHACFIPKPTSIRQYPLYSFVAMSPTEIIRTRFPWSRKRQPGRQHTRSVNLRKVRKPGDLHKQQATRPPEIGYQNGLMDPQPAEKARASKVSSSSRQLISREFELRKPGSPTRIRAAVNRTLDRLANDLVNLRILDFASGTAGSALGVVIGITAEAVS